MDILILIDIDWYWLILTVLIYSIYSLPSITGLMHGIKDLQNPDGAPALHHPPGSLGESWPNGSTTCGISCLEHLVNWKRVFHPVGFLFDFFAGEQWWTLLDSLMAHASLWNSGCFKDSCNMSRYQLFRHTMSSKQAKQTNVAVSHPLWGDDRFPHFVCIESMKRKSFSNFTEQPLRPRLIEDSSGRRKSHHQNSPCRLQFQGEYLSGHSERSTFLWLRWYCDNWSYSNYLKVHAGFLMSNLLE